MEDLQDQKVQEESAPQDVTNGLPEEITQEDIVQEEQKTHEALSQLPADVEAVLPEDAQRLFLAAYNGFLANSKDQAAALRVAWQTIEHNDHYAKGEDGKWYRLPDQDTGGGTLGSMSQA